MKIISLLVIACCFSYYSCNHLNHEKNNPLAANSNPLLSLTYDSVIAYDYDGSDQHLIINDSGQLSSTVINSYHLPENKINEVISLLGDASTYGGSLAHCFDPHLGIVFYKNNTVVEHVSICLECNALHSKIPIPESGGFSITGRQKINNLCKAFSFSHCVDSLNTSFDQ